MNLTASYGRVALVVGASSGMGKACAEYLHAHGYYVYGTSRKAAFPADDGYRQERGFLAMIPLDVTDDASIKQAVDFVLAKEGQINILLNCPGFALAGAVEDVSRERPRTSSRPTSSACTVAVGQCCRPCGPSDAA